MAGKAVKMTIVSRLLVVAWLFTHGIAAGAAIAQTNDDERSKAQTVVGTVTKVAARSLTIDRDGYAMVFALGPTTRLFGKGSKAPRDLVWRNPPRPSVADLIKPRDVVMVKYRQAGQTLTATEIHLTEK